MESLSGDADADANPRLGSDGLTRPWLDKFRSLDPAPLTGLEDRPGWAYGAFLLKRFTAWESATHVLTLYYLLSLSSPYQVQIMVSRLRLV